MPGTNFRFGMDSIVGLVPVVRDVVTAAMGAWLVWEARNLGMSKLQIARMTGNVAFDTAVGFVPLLGDAFDFLFKSNTRNLRIVKKWLDKHHPGTRTIEGEIVSRWESYSSPSLLGEGDHTKCGGGVTAGTIIT